MEGNHLGGGTTLVLVLVALATLFFKGRKSK
jgi:hypothetical protein